MIKTSQKKLIELLKFLDVKKNDTIMVHCSSLSFGRIEGGIKGLYLACKQVIGKEGNLIVPTFTYSFRRNQIFNSAISPSFPLIGAFSELIRNKEKSIRSEDPLFSMSCIGPDSEYLMKRRSKNCFGKNSTYDLLLKKNILFVNLGITYSTGLTAFIHLENISNVNYRKNKDFLGLSVKNGKTVKDKAIHFVKSEKIFKNYITNREKVGEILEKKKISKFTKYGYGKHFSLRFKPFSNEVLNILKKDPYAMLKKIRE